MQKDNSGNGVHKGASSSKSQAKSGSDASQREGLGNTKVKQERERKVRRALTFGTLGLVAIGLVVLFIWLMAQGQSKKPVATTSAVAAGSTSASAGSASSSATKSAAGSYGLTIGVATAPVTVDIYQDYLCPWCGKFDRAQATDLKALLDSGKAKVVFHVMNFLDSSSKGTNYSTRAASAFVAVAKQQPDAAFAFNMALYTNQPEEGSSGLTDAQIADLARGAGVSDSVITTFTDKTNADFVAKSDQAVSDEGIHSSPTVKINGVAFKGDLYAAGAFKSAVEAAK